MNKHIPNVQDPLSHSEILHNEDVGKDLNKISSRQPVLPKAEDNPRPSTIERAGAILKKEREGQGVSLEIVHEATKIPMDALRAIEEGYTVRLLSPFYYKGFLKMYANYLGIDVSRVIEGYKEEELPQHIAPDAEEFQIPQWMTNFFSRRRKRQMVVVAGVILSLFLFVKIIGFFMSLGSRPSTKKNIAKTEKVETKVARTAAVKKDTGKTVAKKKETKKVVEQEEKKVVLESPKVPEPEIIPKVEAKVQPVLDPKPAAVVPVPAVAVNKEITLTVRAKQNSWLRVKADGSIVFQSTLRLGAVETWMADDEIEISGKNIDQLEFELNGKMIGTLGRKDHNAKKVVITKNGLSVKN
ncbi:MAG: DUF4115 domain-containing protein [Candidatus Omnitrophica bacterium]|nr:DUF4115 domain-containing protein [Candidatus Omnitrophota bacterium]